jgi:hypothetical protein
MRSRLPQRTCARRRAEVRELGYPTIGGTQTAGRSPPRIRHGCQPPLYSCPPRGASLAATAVYQPRRLEKTVVYHVVQQHLETWPAQVRAAEPDSDAVPPFVERDFRRYLECGILAPGNALMQDLTLYPPRKFRVGEPVIAADDAFVSPTYIPDLANAVLDLLIDAEAGVWHLANANAVSWAQFARAAAQLENQDEGLVQGCRLADLKRSAREPLNSALTSERVQLLSSWENALDRYVWTLSKQPQRSDAEISPNRWAVN